MASSRRREKAAVDLARRAALNGSGSLDDDGMPVNVTSAAAHRASATLAHRLHTARLLAGHEEEPSVEAEAGALLEAETASEIHGLHEFAKAWMEAHKA